MVKHNPSLGSEDYKHFILALMYLEEAEKELNTLILKFRNAGMERTSVYHFLVKQKFKIRMVSQKLSEKEV